MPEMGAWKGFRHDPAANRWYAAHEQAAAEVARLADFGLKERERHQAELERLRAIITSLDCATAERDAAIRRRDQAENRASLYRQQVADLQAERDALKAAAERERQEHDAKCDWCVDGCPCPVCKVLDALSPPESPATAGTEAHGEAGGAEDA